MRIALCAVTVLRMTGSMVMFHDKMGMGACCYILRIVMVVAAAAVVAVFVIVVMVVAAAAVVVVVVFVVMVVTTAAVVFVVVFVVMVVATAAVMRVVVFMLVHSRVLLCLIHRVICFFRQNALQGSLQTGSFQPAFGRQRNLPLG